MKKAIEDFDGINCLVNCAGIAVGAKVVSSRGMHDLSLFEKVLKVNLIGSFNMLRLCADKMQANEPDNEGEKGVVINTASVASCLFRFKGWYCWNDFTYCKRVSIKWYKS
jgi:NAD(P)-dependent dehydrogenase (short-subunit alcohol dehydrogenase family)